MHVRKQERRARSHRGARRRRMAHAGRLPGDILHPQARTPDIRTGQHNLGPLPSSSVPPKTHRDAGDVLLALVARHLRRLALSPRTANQCNGDVTGLPSRKEDDREGGGRRRGDSRFGRPQPRKKVKNQTMSELRSAPLAASRCTKPLLTQTESDKRGGRHGGRRGGRDRFESLVPEKKIRTEHAQSLALAPLTGEEPLMPSIALLGLGKAARDGSGQMKNHTAAILTVVN